MQKIYIATLFQIQSENLNFQPTLFVPQYTHLFYFNWTNQNSNINLDYQENIQTIQDNIEPIMSSKAQKCRSSSSLNRRKEQNQNKQLKQKLKQAPKLKNQTKNKTIKNKTKALPKELRNIIPNTIHQIFCYIHKKSRSGKIVRQYLDNQKVEEDKKFEFERFYLYHKLSKEKINHYMNIKALQQLNKFQQPLCQIYTQKEQINFLRMNRILIHHFLHHEFEANILTSSRMKTETRLWHLIKKRQILDQLVDKLRTY